MSDLADSWQPRTLASLGTYLNGFAFKPRDWGEAGHPIIRIRELLDPTVEPDRYSGNLAEPFKIEDGDLIFSWSATLAVLFWNRGPAYLNQHLFKVNAADDVNSHFLNHLINFNLNNLAARSHGTTMKHITRGDLADYIVRLPAPYEQQRIAQILDILDNHIRTTASIVAKLRLAKHGQLEAFISSLPSSAQHPLSEIVAADICYGIVQAGPYVQGGVPVLTIRDLLGDFETGIHRTSQSIEQRYKRSRTNPGDVLLSVKGTIGRVAIVPAHYFGNISRDMARIRLTSEMIPEFAQQYFSSEIGRRILDLAVVGTTRSEISIHTLKKLKVPVPSRGHQQEIVNVLAVFDQRISSLERDISKLRLLKEGLMSDLLTGRVRIPAEIQR